MRMVLPLLLLSLGACATAPKPGGRPGGEPTPRTTGGPKETAPRDGTEVGMASFYARSLEGRKTASGERYDGAAATCAHRTHRFGTWLRVTRLENGKAVSCRVNDRGPFSKGRVIDLSRSLAHELGFVSKGVTKVRVEPR
ncbi:septal ring lytic transglycosylase RlpA family protein [Vulgatibacter incomptus]|uniref:Probable endolytic peptidoglycan transglycosylase RlpA n=1 Tax=Vulgatibacter incomptus TaxID=1391653 RepID=A0A0K1PD00_9BACT|nr:septal ring lytic transglycosylase RlpA family protein [Vulgatibacter incomptus]AKU90999.1 Rare lipoprotein A [Vulgatibacter incomptus]